MEAIQVTKSEYFNYSGINLDLEFMNGASDNGTSGAEVFIKNVCLDTWDYLKSNYFFDEELFEKATKLDANVVTQYKRALFHQIEYQLTSGNRLLNAELADLIPNVKNLAPRAKIIFKMLGLTNIQPIVNPYNPFRR